MQYILLCMSGFFYSTSCCEFHLCGCTQQVFFLLKLFNSIAVLDCTTVYLFCCLWKFVLFPPVAIMNRVMTSLYIYCDKYKHASLYGIYLGAQNLGVSFSFMPISNPRTSHSFCPQPLSCIMRPQQKLLLCRTKSITFHYLYK